ncbi:MAG: hypothetical protein JEZ11_12640 [Desulfobacterales bacterium]|nr:hypothetical protein [Desulfobacterales bacterium]
MTVRQVTRRYCTMAMGLSLTVGTLLLATGNHALGKGLILGTTFAAVDFVLMAQTLPARLRSSAGQAALRSLAAMAGRTALKAVPLVMAVKSDQFDFPMTVVGIFSIHLCLMADHVRRT